MSNIPVDPDEIRDPMSPREQIMANVAVIKEAIKLDWVRMAEDGMTPEERQALRAQINEWSADLANLAMRLDQLHDWERVRVIGFLKEVYHTVRAIASQYDTLCSKLNFCFARTGS